jgi:hypothetical protein
MWNNERQEKSTNEQTITYTATEGTTQRGQRKLVSSDVLKAYFELKKILWWYT